ncbi:hypothetical protein QJS10_CPA16g00581 [Acorus calamus]|uniref:Uncharacterized protein n=1 Tax=Acorus calamus TaxID=4465 RepID=A0AAV9D0X1_ACOCL|nr:hypothetical protein QJS10_CPA16g00581 [Acorus calamus]
MEAIDVKRSESVEDLLDRGDSESASALLHSLIAKLDFPSSSADLRLVSTLTDPARIYSSRGLSFKADELRERALLECLGNKEMEAIDVKRSESVEDLLDRGNSESASALLHSLIAKLDFPSSSADLRLVSTLTDPARIYSSRGLSFKADELRERALLVRARAQRSVVPALPVLGDSEDPVKEDYGGVRVSASAEGDDDETPRQPLKERFRAR